MVTVFRHISINLWVIFALLVSLSSAHAACPHIKSKGLRCEAYNQPPALAISKGEFYPVLFFSYTCLKCSLVHKASLDWENKENGLRVHRWHVSWHGGDEFARIHFALKNNGFEESLSQRLFDSIRNKNYKGPDDIVAWAATTDTAARFPRLARGLKTKMDSAEAREYAVGVNAYAEKLEIETIPQFVVHGKHRVLVLDTEPETLLELEALLTTLWADRW